MTCDKKNGRHTRVQKEKQSVLSSATTKDRGVLGPKRGGQENDFLPRQQFFLYGFITSRSMKNQRPQKRLKSQKKKNCMKMPMHWTSTLQVCSWTLNSGHNCSSKQQLRTSDETLSRSMTQRLHPKTHRTTRKPLWLCCCFKGNFSNDHNYTVAQSFSL